MLENDVDKLAYVTNGNCGIVMLMRRKHKGNEIVEIESSKHIEQPLTIKQTFETYGKRSFNDFVEKINVTVEQQNIIQEQTAKQSSENSWFEYRCDRITASKFKDSVVKVNADYSIINPGKSRALLSKICGYYPRYESKACKWGISNEAVA